MANFHSRMARYAVAATALAALSSPCAATDSVGDTPSFEPSSGALTPAGVLYLEMDSAVNQFRFAPSDTTQPGSTQAILVESKCIVGNATTGSLAYLDATGGNSMVGWGPTSLGVWDGPKGVACYRVSKDVAPAGETLGVAARRADSNPGFRMIYALQLDLEVKRDAAVRLDIYAGNELVDTHHLYTGASTALMDSSDPNSSICAARSDSGPDAGPADNCLWRIDGILGDSFRLTPEVGEFSLEGGGDWTGAEADHRTELYLAEGSLNVLDCSGTTLQFGGRAGEPSCSVHQLQTAACTPMAVILSADPSTNSCQIDKATSSTGNQLVGELDVVFPDEAWESLLAAPTRTTKVYFPGASDPFEPDLCIDGLSASDPSGVDAGNDQVAGDGVLEWACILSHQVDYKGQNSSLHDLMQVTQKILFWGDIAFSRN